MKSAINPQWINYTSFDSGAPSGGATVAHRFTTPGEYKVRFVDEREATLGETLLAVAPETPAKIAAAQNAVLDLVKVAYPKNLGDTIAQRDPVFVKPEGYVSFTSGTQQPFAVVAAPVAGAAAAFDTRRLGEGDVFALTLLRPGEYRMTNELSRAEGRITVSYPVIG